MQISLPYGHGRKELTFPDHLRVDVLKPSIRPRLQSPAQTLEAALRSPLGGARLQNLAEPRTVAVVVPDETRPFPVAELLPVLFAHLRGVWPTLSADRVTVIVGGGLHPPMDEAGLARVVPHEVRCGVRVLPHDAKHGETAFLGVTTRGTPVHINKTFASADLRIVMGQIDPHQFMGFTGGSKGACVGLAGAETIRKNHSLMFEPGAEAGVLEDNPPRQDLNEAGDMLGIHLAVNVVNGPDKKPVWLAAGTPRAVLSAGAKVCAQVYGVELETSYDMVVASCGGHPKDICLYQAQKGLNMASRAAKPGGKLLLLAACAQGVGDDDYFEYSCRFNTMRETLDDFLSGEFRMGAHKAFLFAKSILNFDVVVDSELEPKVLARCHLAPGDSQQTILRWAGELPENARVAVVPNANTTYFHQGQALSPEARSINPQGGKGMIQFLVHEKADTVGVATVDIKAGETASGLYMDSQDKIEVKALEDIPLGHKLALVPMKEGDTVLKYGHDIGKVVAPFEKGAHVHVHNLKTKRW